MLKKQVCRDAIRAAREPDANGMPQPKRRRLRRHPVWMFFKDLEDRVDKRRASEQRCKVNSFQMVGCINCSFRTGSAFSTNLKMHLKAHHKEDYERVLKLEGDMRVEENVTGPPNKIKNELIDFHSWWRKCKHSYRCVSIGKSLCTSKPWMLRYTGFFDLVANMVMIRPPPFPRAHPSAPRASPLIQQFISQTMAARQGNDSSKKDSLDEDPFNGMSMSDKLAALVGLVPAPGGVEGEIKQEDEPEEPVPSVQSAFDEIRRAADNMLAANMGLAPPPQEQTIVNLNVDPDTTATAETFLSSLTLLNQLLTSCSGGDIGDGAGSSSEGSATETPPIFDVSTLTYDGLFDGLTALQKHFGVDELTSFVITIQLLQSSAKNAEERVIVDSVSGGLERIYNLNFETNRSERTKKLISEKMKLKRLFETSEQREHRLQRMKERYRQQREAQECEKPDRRKEGASQCDQHCSQVQL
ncbi:hypothetical protein OSTOST_07122 [Ostertagia ostertagi]